MSPAGSDQGTVIYNNWYAKAHCFRLEKQNVAIITVVVVVVQLRFLKKQPRLIYTEIGQKQQ